MFSPHAWGWTAMYFRMQSASSVFPTRVGVDQASLAADKTRQRFPHTRGGGPDAATGLVQYLKFSPHAWGWTLRIAIQQPETPVFPTRVGVDREELLAQIAELRFPHTRGGGPLLWGVTPEQP